MSDDSLDPFWGAVKLVRAADLKTWDRFPRYEDHAGIPFLQYKAEAGRIEKLAREVRPLLKARDRIRQLNRDDLEEYNTEVIQVGASLRRNRVSIPLPKAQHAETVYEAIGDADIAGDVLIVRTKWRSQEVQVRMSCPARVLHAQEIASNEEWLEQCSPEEKAKLRDVESSWWSHPVLFISHRWRSFDHPDPDGSQLSKLRELTNCFLVYDYSSFPQDRSSHELAVVLRNMTLLINNVVVLSSPDYVDRGWCIYEYIVASMRASIVCDEVNDPDFVELLRWSATKPPVSMSFKGHSFESNIQNTINKGVLETVNRIRPQYVKSSFTVPADRAIVTGLLIDDLMQTLPNRKEYPDPHLGEWLDKSWKRQELEAAFTEHLDWDDMKKGWEHLGTVNIKPTNFTVPRTISEAVARGYAIERPRPMTELQALARMFAGPIGNTRER